jgi:hypothetical protein
MMMQICYNEDFIQKLTYLVDILKTRVFSNKLMQGPKINTHSIIKMMQS